MRESKKNPAACTAWELVYSYSSEAQKGIPEIPRLGFTRFPSTQP